MRRPPTDPDRQSARYRPTWQDVLVAWGMLALVPLLLWTVSDPLAGGLTMAALVGLALAGRRAIRLARCLSECESLTLDIGRQVHITVGEPCVCDPS